MNNKYTVLIVEDENNISNFISAILNANNYTVLRAKDGAEGLMMVTSHCPDIMLLDLGLPDMDGQRIIKAVRDWSGIPIVVVSARNSEKDKVQALDMGADDYITKPFGTSELLARIRTALRHSRNKDADDTIIQSGKLNVGPLCVDFDKRHVYIDGENAHLTQNEFKIVALLAKYVGRVLTYDYLIKNIWGPNVKCDNQILRVNMANIRRKIEKNPAEPKYIVTEMGVGYRMLESQEVFS